MHHNIFKTGRLLHGGDYNPEQWLDRPDLLEEDIRILKLTGSNTVTLGVFAWSVLEPEEGVYCLDWLARIIDRLYEAGISTILATPSGARPKWLSDKYPEGLRTNERREKQLFGFRHNHCPTSPVYREKVAAVDRKLSERFGSHPGVILWHISNELSGECHCPLCQEAFRQWLRGRYASIDELNRKWYTYFWSHAYNSFDQIESPSPAGEMQLHALNLEWSRFITEQTASFIRCEREALQQYSALPVTTNFLYYFKGLDYVKLAQELDVVSWDTYPTWHKDALIDTARDNALWHDMMRSLKDRPFLVMESCPSSTNWQGVSKLKKPGVLLAQAMQGIAHGADSSMYFQVRQSRGASEKFHGAIISHCGRDDTRVVREVTDVGRTLERFSCLAGTKAEASAAILYDWDSIRSMEDSQGPRSCGLHFKELLLRFYDALRGCALDVDLVDETSPLSRLSRYRILILPMVYQFREGFAEKLRAYTENGGTLVTTFWSGVADETDLCYLGETPHGLTEVLGLYSEEIDGLYDREENRLVPAAAGAAAPKTEEFAYLQKEYPCKYLCDLVRTKQARSVLVYGQDFYRGRPALTVNRFGKGEAWYVACHAQGSFCQDLVRTILQRNGIEALVPGPVPAGLEITSRTGEENGQKVRYLICQHFGTEPVSLPLPDGDYEIIEGGSGGMISPLECVIIKKPQVWCGA